MRYDILNSIMRDDYQEISRILKEEGLSLSSSMEEDDDSSDLLIHFLAHKAFSGTLRRLIKKFKPSQKIVDRISDSTEKTPLCIAISQSRFDNADILLKAGADINHISMYHQFMSGCRRGDIAQLEYMLNNGLEVHPFPALTFDNRMPLHDAVLGNQPSVVSFLLEQGFPANEKDSSGASPLDLAEKRSFKEIIQILKRVAE